MVRVKKAEFAPTVAPGQKCEISIANDIATVKEKSVTKYLVAFRCVRRGLPDLWLGVKIEDGEIQDKNEIVGLTFHSFTSNKNGKKTKTLSRALQSPN